MFSAKRPKKKASKASKQVATKSVSKAETLVQMRDMLEELSKRSEGSAIFDAVTGVLLQAEKAIEDQAAEIQFLRKMVFGRKSEKLSPNQLSLFADMLSTLTASAEVQSEGEAASPEPKAKRKKPRRRLLVPTKTIKVLVPDEERACPECGVERCRLGHKRTLVVEYTPPKIDVIEYLREQVVCRPCEGNITIAPPPKERVIDGAYPGNQLLTALVINKTVDGLPLNRTQKIFKRSGLDIPTSTLNKWEGYGEQLLEPLTKRIKALVLGSDTINLDDTGLRVKDPKLKGTTHRGHVWVLVGRKYDPGGDLSKTQESVYYFYAPTWHAKYPEEVLKNCGAALQGDAYRGYERIADGNRGDGVTRLLAGCCMHARRPFVQALEMKDPAALYFVERFQKVYRIEAEARDMGLPAGERLVLRKDKSLPLLLEMRERAEELQSMPLAKPMEQGVTYLLNQWEKLMVPFEQDGRMEIDNGVAERYLRRLAAGRKSWLFAGSESGAERITALLSLVSTAEGSGVDPGHYIADVLPRLGDTLNRDLDQLLPYAWGLAGEEAAQQAPTAQAGS